MTEFCINQCELFILNLSKAADTSRPTNAVRGTRESRAVYSAWALTVGQQSLACKSSISAVYALMALEAG